MPWSGWMYGRTTPPISPAVLSNMRTSTPRRGEWVLWPGRLLPESIFGNETTQPYSAPDGFHGLRNELKQHPSISWSPARAEAITVTPLLA